VSKERQEAGGGDLPAAAARDVKEAYLPPGAAFGFSFLGFLFSFWDR
jgi:hypothetical protein